MAARTTPKKPGEAPTAKRILVLHGKELFLRAERTRALKEALEKEHGRLDVFRFDGASARPGEVLDECRTFGLMASHKLVIVDNADKMISGGDDDDAEGGGGGKRGPGRPLFEKYAASPSDGATLLLRADKWNKGKKLDDLITKSGAIMDCKPLTNPGDAVARASAMAKERHGVEIDRAAAAALVERVGLDLSRLDMELGKLAAASGGKAITRPLVAELSGEASDEAVWGIQSVLLSGNAAAGLERLRSAVEVARHAAPFVMWVVIDIARKLHAASRGLREGGNAFTVARALKLWGESEAAVMEAAKRVDPARAAALFDAAVEADARSKSGYTTTERSLEMLAVRFAETVGG